MAGWKMPKLSIFEDKLDGLSRTSCMTIIGGLPSVGKSTLSRNIALEIALNNEDAMVMYMSVDDPAKSVLRSWAATMTEIDMGSLVKYQSLTNTEQVRWDDGWTKLRAQDNLCVFDVTQGNSLDDLQWHIDYFRKRNPDRKIVLFVDSLNRVSMGDNDLRQSVMNTSMGLREITTKQDIHTVVVANLRKSNKLSQRQRDRDVNPDVDMFYRPHPEEISETVHVWYEAELLIMCHNQLAIANSTGLTWDYQSMTGESIRMPYLEANVWKNKTENMWISDGFSTQLFFKLNRFLSSVESVDFKTLPTTGLNLNSVIDKGKEALDRFSGAPDQWQEEVQGE